jgi:uncharacterized protein YbaP (TraB family)
MYKHFYLFAFVIINFLSCASESSEKETEADQIKDVVVKNGNSLLWKIEGNGCTPSYMYGTMHMINKEYYHFTDGMRERIASSKAIMMEVGGMPNPFETLSLMTLDSGDVRDYFSPEQMKIVVEFFDKEMNQSPEEFYQLYGSMKPFFLLQSITQTYFDKGSQSYDLDIMGIAAEEGIPLLGFESIQEQLGFFDKIPKESMAQMVIESIENFEEEKKETQKMMKIYSEQKVDKLIPMIKKQSPEFMEFENLFLYDRNKAWIPTIKEQVKDKQCFIAVGAAHLFGEGGVIDLLEKEGYTLTAVSTD